MKRIFATLLALSLVFVLFGCDFDYAGKIVGTWEYRKAEDKEVKDSLFDSIELYDEEKALVDTPLFTVKTVVFNEDGTYYFTEEPENVKVCVREFFEGLFTDLYEGRSTLATCYEVDISTLSEEDFYKFYYEMYGYTGMDEMLDALAENIYDYDSFEAYEKGSYKVTSKVISFDAEDDELDGTAEYEVTEDKLTIEYSDGTEVYTKVN